MLDDEMTEGPWVEIHNEVRNRPEDFALEVVWRRKVFIGGIHVGYEDEWRLAEEL